MNIKYEVVMTLRQHVETAQQLGLMAGHPAAAEKRVSPAQQLYAPFNRWSFQHELQLNRTADVWRGTGAVAPFVYALQDLDPLPYPSRADVPLTFGDMVRLSFTDGIMVLHRGKVIYERYLNDMQPHALHAWASCSKSMTGTLAAWLAHEGIIDPEQMVAAYVPELATSGFGNATMRQVMEMTTAVAFHAPTPDPVAESREYGIALGWLPAPAGYDGPMDSYAFLPTMITAGTHGERFRYLTPNTDVLAWVLKRALNQSLAEIMHERLWSKLGAERDAFWIVDGAAAETAGSGLVTTLRDMARFGQMMVQLGEFNGQQIIPAAVIDGIAQGGDQDAFARGPAASPMNQGWSYHCGWWMTHNQHRAYLGLGYGGQVLYIDPVAQLVVAKLSSYPTPTPAGNEFYGALAAIPALANALAEA
jgi:hypothetical protein